MLAATTSTTKGGQDTNKPESELDSRFDNNESQESESATNSKGHHSEDQQSDEDVSSTSTTDSMMEYNEEPCNDVFNCEFPDV